MEPDRLSRIDPRGRIAVYSSARRAVLLDAGGAHQRAVRLPISVRNHHTVAHSPAGLAIGGKRGKIAVLSWDGRVRALLTGSQDPAALAPDGRTLLVTDRRGRRLSLVDIPSGHTTRVGTADGEVLGGAWTVP